MPEISIGRRKIGPGHPVYLIAEMSANHNQDFEEALRIMEAAKAAGADAVKIQTYTADTMTLASERDGFTVGKGSVWEGRQLHDLYREAHTPWDWQPKLMAAAASLGMDFFSTAFDASAVDFLEGMGVPVHKVASFELVDIPLIKRMARTGKPLIISTGMSTLEEVREAVEAARGAGATQIALLKCTSAYPALPEDMNLLGIPFLAETFGAPAGLSDHTLDTTVPVAAVALGACIIEKHFTLTRSNPGPDSSFSLEPAEFKEMVRSVRAAEASLGRAVFSPGKKETDMLAFRRSVYVAETVRAGETFDERNLRVIRPGHGLHPRHWEALLGRKARADLAPGTPLTWDMVD
jgi:pseudaminic acid synthase